MKKRGKLLLIPNKLTSLSTRCSQCKHLYSSVHPKMKCNIFFRRVSSSSQSFLVLTFAEVMANKTFLGQICFYFLALLYFLLFSTTSTAKKTVKIKQIEKIFCILF